MKNKKIIIILAIVAVIGIIAGWLVGSYNGLVKSQIAVEEAMSNVQIQLQRRADLIPNFVNTVQGYSDYEKETFTAVTQARTAAYEATTPDSVQQADEQLNGAIDVWVNAVTEAYPELKANQSYIALQDELAGTENRVARVRTQYNEAAKSYNTKVRRFPSNIIASMFGFERVEMFTAGESAQDVPQVSFN